MSIKEMVQEKYGQAALRVVAGEANGCCGASGCGPDSWDPAAGSMYYFRPSGWGRPARLMGST